MGRYVKDISTVLHPGMAVEVYVIDVDVKRRRISLRMELGKRAAREKSAVK